jgi:alkylation response protein AidB-like acyl-CoA dehydrogenase
MKLAAMESAQTVTAELAGLFLPEQQVAFLRPAGWIQNNDQINITLQGHFALGCAMAGLDILWENSQKKPLPFLQSTYEALSFELASCRTEIADITGLEDDRLKVRAWAIDLAVRCAHAAVASSSGAANSVSHPAQRVYREALVFTVSAQTSAIMESTLDRLRRD